MKIYTPKNLTDETVFESFNQDSIFKSRQMCCCHIKLCSDILTCDECLLNVNNINKVKNKKENY